MGKLTPKQKNKLAYEILDLLKEYKVNGDVDIYFDNKCLTGKGMIIENRKGSDYIDYANDNTISMTFEGSFYEIINGYYPKTSNEIISKFNEILSSYGLCYELGNNWNLITYYIDADLNEDEDYVEEGSRPKNPIYISKSFCPVEIERIRAEWEKQQNAYGDVGSCVLGAGFRFKHMNLFYKMPPQGRTQGSLSWEASRDVIEKMLLDAGCEEIKYNWGTMD